LNRTRTSLPRCPSPVWREATFHKLTRGRLVSNVSAVMALKSFFMSHSDIHIEKEKEREREGETERKREGREREESEGNIVRGGWG
jgi:hypothetical protein